MFDRRYFLIFMISIFTACQQPVSPGKLSIGVVSFGETTKSVEQYSVFKAYLEQQLNSLIELEPTFNEVQALQQIERQSWDLVLAPPGLAAIALSQAKYVPIFALEGVQATRSVFIVLADSPITELSDLQGKIIALGQPGSATGYYLPIYNLYGLTLAEIRFAPTPKDILIWIGNQEVVAGAMSLEQFNRYRSEFPFNKYRILYRDEHDVPSGSILISTQVNLKQKTQIMKALENVPPAIAASAGYIPNAPVPEYQYLIEVVRRVAPIAERIKETPAPLYEKSK